MEDGGDVLETKEITMAVERDIENHLIEKLVELKYTYRNDIRDRATLEKNFRDKFESLNKVKLSNSEFERLLEEIITPDVFSSSKCLREINTFSRDDGTPLHYTLVNIKDWCKNTFEVVNQLKMNTDYSHQRYDVMILINGIPLVQIELKTLGKSPRKAMQQIVDYKNDPGNGYTRTLLSFVQIFIVSNLAQTWYFANNNARHFSFDADERFLPIYQFANDDNKKINHLDDFSEKFLMKCTLGEMISKYMVLVASEQKLLMMRPYQIYAVKSIVDCIHQNRGNGYIWHTTGSGKTLTSFKTSTLLKDNPDVDKCLFVVDRKDLDRQTREEFNKFQEGCVEENTNTETLVQRLLSNDYANKVIVTTIQKLGLALDGSYKNNYKERLEPLKKKRIVFIFDECHRSQFGENHKSIKEFFENAQLFGFTGTPIFEKNSNYQQINGQNCSYKTTVDIFEKELHAYTITHAIEDRNVLRFHVDYYKPDGDKKLKSGDVLTKEAVVKAIIKKHDDLTSKRRFNSVLATASINDAIEYHNLFKEIQTGLANENPEYKMLNTACVFSPPAEGNKDVQQIQEDLPQEKIDNSVNPDEKKESLKKIIADYNKCYKTNHDINNFDLYYQDVQKRIKDHQYSNQDYSHNNKIDIMIVVDMLLTGFDSKYLNTLYVDKNLKYHGLIQAFSRTNRILNDTKPYGNIIDFRQQENAVDEAITLFSGTKTEEYREIWLVDPAPVVIGKYEEAVKSLDKFMRSQGLECAPEEVTNLKGDEARGQFINIFKEVQRLKTQLDQYTDMTEEDKNKIDVIIPKDKLQSFRGVYIETAKILKDITPGEGERKPQEELDFEFVLFASAMIDYDYIVSLMSKYTQIGKHKMTREELIGIINADAKFFDEREEMVEYINTLKVGGGLNESDIKKGYEKFKEEKSEKHIYQISEKYGLEGKTVRKFIDKIISRMIFDGEELTKLFEPLELGWKVRAKKESELMTELIPILHKLAHGKEISGLNAYEKN